MVATKISELGAAPSVDKDSVIVVNEGGTTYRCTAKELLDVLSQSDFFFADPAIVRQNVGLPATSFTQTLLEKASPATVRAHIDASQSPLDEDDFASNSATRPSSQRATAAYIATLPFTKSYASAAQSVSSGSLITLPHGLGARPKVVSLLAQFTSATNGYSAGDIAMINSGYEFPSSSSASRGFAVVLTATEIKVRCSNSGGVGMVDFSDGGRGQVSMSDMKLIVEAWA